jgi:flagellar protein FliO/FliZ
LTTVCAPMRSVAVLVILFGCLVVPPATAAQPPLAPAAPSLSVDAPKDELKLPLADIELPKSEPAPEELNLGWTLVRTFVVLGFVIMAIYVTLNFGLRRLMGISAMPRGQALVQVLERVPLDQKRAMFVVKAAGEYLLIGGGDSALALITKLDASEVEKLQVQRVPPIALSPFLLKLLKRREVPAPPTPGDNR